MLARTQQIWLLSRRSAVKIMNSTYSDYEGRVPGNRKFFDHQPSRALVRREKERRENGKEKKARKKQTQHSRLRKFLMPLMSIRPTCFSLTSHVSHVLSHVDPYIVMALVL